MFSYISPEKRVPTDHPLRPIRRIVDEILKEMSPKFQKGIPTWGKLQNLELMATRAGFIQHAINRSGVRRRAPRSLLRVRSLRDQSRVADLVNQCPVADLQVLRCFSSVPVIAPQRLDNRVALHLANRLFGDFLERHRILRTVSIAMRSWPRARRFSLRKTFRTDYDIARDAIGKFAQIS